MEGKADEINLSSVLSALIRLSPFEATGSGELGFLWITEIINSGYEERWRERMASEVVESLGKHFFPEDSVPSINMEPAWIPSLLGFLSLSEKLDRQGEDSLTALRILETSAPSTDFGIRVLPILVPPLLPTYPLQSRRIALPVFYTFAPSWFSSQMENVPSKDLDKLVQAVGDPFQFPDFPLQDGKPVDLPYYNPTVAAAVLIGFASSDLWRNCLRRSNFTSLEETVSTWDGKKAALERMAYYDQLPESLFVATGIFMAIRRFEELQCPNTAEVLLMWAWTIGVVDPVDRDGWELIGRSTLRFCETRRMERLVTLKRHITDTTMESVYAELLLIGRYGKSKVKDFVKKSSVLKLQPDFWSRFRTFLYLSQACQLRRLYQIFRCNPTTWKDAVAASEVGEGNDIVSWGRSVAISPFMDWACDYP